MKALILSAGFGTRLRPYTEKVPKPLFPVGGRPLLDIIIAQLIEAGATAVCVNTHHLSERIETFLKKQSYPVPVIVRCEPEILGTGGAMKYFSDILENAPFVVINSDLLTNIDIHAVYQDHLKHECPVTMVLHDHELFNNVSVDIGGYISGFPGPSHEDLKLLAFTGIQVVDPMIFRYIQSGQYASSIDIYNQMIQRGEKIRAHLVHGRYWNDLGTPERYRQGVLDHMVPKAFSAATGEDFNGSCSTELLAGDGSDRKWYRITAGENSLILADHGIYIQEGTGECDAYVAIGNHLFKKRVPVPRIYAHDRFSGLVLTEDLGDGLLQEYIRNQPDTERIMEIYRTIIGDLIRLSLTCSDGFDPCWAYQGDTYDRDVIIEKEGGYFIRAFLEGYLGYKDLPEEKLTGEFAYLADRIMDNGLFGLMHRDMQSRNIMVKEDRCYFIDFQGARFGPLQYDLAALLFDPYVDLDRSVRNRLFEFAVDRVQTQTTFNREDFLTGYEYCGVSRLMQALGAFGFLTRVKKKTQFTPYIPVAFRILHEQLTHLDDPNLTSLRRIVELGNQHLV